MPIILADTFTYSLARLANDEHVDVGWGARGWVGPGAIDESVLDPVHICQGRAKQWFGPNGLQEQSTQLRVDRRRWVRFDEPASASRRGSDQACRLEPFNFLVGSSD